MVCEAGGQVVEAEAHGVRLGVGQVIDVVQGQQPQPRVEIGGNVRGEYSAVGVLL
jgi:hypothetical protein